MKRSSKKLVAFRLSQKSLARLKREKKRTGKSKTRIVETAILNLKP